MWNWVEAHYGEEDLPFDFYGVNIAENVNLVREYAAQLGLEMPIILGANGLLNQYRVRGGISPFPVDYIIDGDGIVRYANHEYEPELILMVIDRLLYDDPGDGVDGSPIEPTPQAWLLSPAYPNPFNGTVGFALTAPFGQNATVAAFDVQGRRVAMLFDGRLRPGVTRLTWRPDETPAGVYLIRATGVSGSAGAKVTFLK